MCEYTLNFDVYNDIDDFSKYHVDKAYGSDKEEVVNLNYIAIILRIADLLHITRDRTPSITRRIINISNPVSVIEWEKQGAVKAVKAKGKRDEDNNVNLSLDKDTIEITAAFEGAETANAYFGLSSYLQYVRKELQQCKKIVEKSQKSEGASNYLFPWKEIDESRILVKGFEPKKLQFTLEQENILKLLVGHTLYNDSSVVVRELVQNAIDAVRLQKLYDKKNNEINTDGKVVVEWHEEVRELIFWDNGTGMTIADVENYLLKVGASKYRDEKVLKDFPDFSSISHFGIGVLTCFMVADDIDIITNATGQSEANSISLRKVNGSYLLRKLDKKELDVQIRDHGTMVKLHIRKDISLDNLEKDLSKWIVVPEVPVYLRIEDKGEIKIGEDSLGAVLKRYLDDTGRKIDNERYAVHEETIGNITVAYAVQHMKYYSDWNLMRVSINRDNRNIQLPVGVCVEGIRVEFTTPGYQGASILAIANVKNSKYKTNVARSAIELDANNEIMSGIYDIYQKHIQSQMDSLEEKGYSKSWAALEGSYLMSHLFSRGFHEEYIAPTNKEMLIKSMAKTKCIVLEGHGSREVVSAEDVYDMSSIDLIESKMFQAVESLLCEIKTTATIRNLIKIVCPDDIYLRGGVRVLCNYDSSNVLHRYALSNKEVEKIIVDYERRQIRLSYSFKQDIWYEFAIRTRDGISRVCVPKGTFLIEGLNDEVGVKAFGTVFVHSNSALYHYIVKIIDKFMANKPEENIILLEMFLGNIFESRILEHIYSSDINVNSIVRELMEDRPMRFNSELQSKFWEMIDVHEFAEVVLGKNYSLFSINNWDRHSRY